MAGKYGLLVHAREVYINTSPSFVPETFETYLPHFTRVHTPRISGFDVARFLPAFERYFAQFVPTLRSLDLPYVTGGIQEVLEFICKFPHLNNLFLTPSGSYRTDIRPPSRLSVEHSPPLKGTLVLGGWATSFVRFLLKVPGGLHFRSINAGDVNKGELEEILVACSSDLEVLSFHPLSRKFTQYYLPSSKIRYKSLNQPPYPAPDAVDLSRNLALSRLQLRVNHTYDLALALSALRKTLSTISSPVFSEFTLKLDGIPVAIHFFQILLDNEMWRDECGLIDRHLNEMVHVVGRDIRLVVQVEGSGVWSPTLGGLAGDTFPVMNARGLVSVKAVKSVDIF